MKPNLKKKKRNPAQATEWFFLKSKNSKRELNTHLQAFLASSTHEAVRRTYIICIWCNYCFSCNDKCLSSTYSNTDILRLRLEFWGFHKTAAFCILLCPVEMGGPCVMGYWGLIKPGPSLFDFVSWDWTQGLTHAQHGLYSLLARFYFKIKPKPKCLLIKSVKSYWEQWQSLGLSCLKVHLLFAIVIFLFDIPLVL